MSWTHLRRRALVALVSLGTILSSTLGYAQQPTPQGQTKIQLRSMDVSLAAGNRLQGQVVDAAGQAVAGAPITLIRDGQPLHRATSGPNGAFSLENVRGGTYLMVAANQVHKVRAWAPRTAPPQANAQVLVATPGTMRGQWAPRNLYERVEGNPWVWYPALAGAIVIPIAVIGHNQPDGS